MNCCKHKLLIGPLGWQPLLTGLIKLSTAINWDLLGCQHKSLSATCLAPWQDFLTLFHTRGVGIVVLHVMVPQPFFARVLGVLPVVGVGAV
jgi:hypothetical protein